MASKKKTDPKFELVPCPVCRQPPTDIAEWNGWYIIRCLGTDEARHIQIGTGSWQTPEKVAGIWNDGCSKLRPAVSGDIYPCPICGGIPRINEWEDWCWIECRNWGYHLGYLFGAASARTREDAVSMWNAAIEKMARNNTE